MENIGIEYDDCCLKVIFSGEITFDITQEVKHALEPHLCLEDMRACVFDMDSVVFLDSSGIGLLIAVNTRMQNKGTPMYLYKPSEQVRKTLDMVQLLNFFNVMESEDDLRKLSEAPA